MHTHIHMHTHCVYTDILDHLVKTNPTYEPVDIEFHPATGQIDSVVTSPLSAMLYDARMKTAETAWQITRPEYIRRILEKLPNVYTASIAECHAVATWLIHEDLENYLNPEAPKKGEGPNAGITIKDEDYADTVQLWYDPREVPEGKTIDWLFQEMNAACVDPLEAARQIIALDALNKLNRMGAIINSQVVDIPHINEHGQDVGAQRKSLIPIIHTHLHPCTHTHVHLLLLYMQR